MLSTVRNVNKYTTTAIFTLSHSHGFISGFITDYVYYVVELSVSLICRNQIYLNGLLYNQKCQGFHAAFLQLI